MAEMLYINKHHSTMIQKLQSGKHNEWAKTIIDAPPSSLLDPKGSNYVKERK
jgi:hypothetical protein